MTTALILVDIQNDYFPGGKGELYEPIAASLRARELLDHFRRMHWPLVHIQHVAIKPGAKTMLPGSVGGQIHENVRPIESEHEVVFQKHYPNSFRDTPLLDYLKQQGVTRVVICGMQTNMCVDATTRAAFDFGFECVVAHDACAARTLAFQGQTIPAPQVHGAFLAALAASYGKVLSVEEIIAEMATAN
jgi:nicotinamidase-related amidase